HAIGRVPAGATVADIGCGAGTDLLLAARRAGPRGRAIGVDMTEAMRQRATAGASACGLDNVEVRNGDATRLPIDERSVDVAITSRFDCFAGTTKERTARRYGVVGVNLCATKSALR